jgi:hypothetical protein
MKMYGEYGGIAARIFKLGFKWKRVLTALSSRFVFRE